jgi:hypothetical protein
MIQLIDNRTSRKRNVNDSSCWVQVDTGNINNPTFGLGFSWPRWRDFTCGPIFIIPSIRFLSAVHAHITPAQSKGGFWGAKLRILSARHQCHFKYRFRMYSGVSSRCHMHLNKWLPPLRIILFRNPLLIRKPSTY